MPCPNLGRLLWTQPDTCAMKKLVLYSVQSSRHTDIWQTLVILVQGVGVKSTQRGEGEILFMPCENCVASKPSDLPAWLWFLWRAARILRSLTRMSIGKVFPFFFLYFWLEICMLYEHTALLEQEGSNSRKYSSAHEPSSLRPPSLRLFIMQQPVLPLVSLFSLLPICPLCVNTPVCQQLCRLTMRRAHNQIFLGMELETVGKMGYLKVGFPPLCLVSVCRELSSMERRWEFIHGRPITLRRCADIMTSPFLPKALR